MSHFFSKRISLAHMVVLMAVILIGCLLLTLSLKNEATGLKNDITTARLEKSSLQRENAATQQELDISGTDAYIESKARDTQGYLMPGEIQFVITNPEALYGTGTDVQIEVAGN